MKLLCPNSAAERAVARLVSHLKGQGDIDSASLVEKLQDAPGDLLVVAPESGWSGDVARPGRPHLPQRLAQAWAVAGDGCADGAQRELAWAVIEGSGEPILAGCWMGCTTWEARESYPTRSFLWRFRESAGMPGYFYLVPRDARTGLFALDLVILVNLAQIGLGALPVHASAVVSGGKLLVFCGRSGAGKSTVAHLSELCGAAVLDDDQILTAQQDGGAWLARAWSGGLTPCDAPVGAVFQLVKADHDSLVVLPPSDVARLLLASVHQVLGAAFTGSALQQAFRKCASLARVVPGFRLEFRKSTGFWPLVEKAGRAGVATLV